MVKFVKIEKIRVYEAADAKKKITWAGDLRKTGFGKSVITRWREYINLDNFYNFLIIAVRIAKRASCKTGLPLHTFSKYPVY